MFSDGKQTLKPKSPSKVSKLRLKIYPRNRKPSQGLYKTRWGSVLQEKIDFITLLQNFSEKELTINDPSSFLVSED